jgi:hypothetical protein
MSARKVLAFAFALACGLARAETIVQTLTGGEFQPGIDQLETFTFDQFDTLGGTRELVSVTIALTQYSWGGEYEIDNDGATIANFTAQLGASGRLQAGYILPPGAGNTINAVTAVGPMELAANDSDGVGYQWDGGPDNFRIDGPDRDHAVTASTSGTLTSSLEAFIGTGELTIDYISNQLRGNNAEGATAGSWSSAWAQGVVTITYEYNQVPEPGSLALLALGCVVLGMRRRPSIGKRA